VIYISLLSPIRHDTNKSLPVDQMRMLVAVTQVAVVLGRWIEWID
jgi:hypothetical protein